MWNLTLTWFSSMTNIFLNYLRKRIYLLVSASYFVKGNRCINLNQPL